ncbi:peptide deformylase [Thermoanaerobacter mathranii]|uniref:peptide deformylase n=1 Tax=Thermoanaerobacter mathranii TaxID=583357 RepID=UPI0001B0FC71|nr:peptide deformylase [Thermoanaerobacter mathranii]
MAAEIADIFSPIERRHSIVSKAQEIPIHPGVWTYKDIVAATFQHEIDTIDSVISFHNEDVFRIILTT